MAVSINILTAVSGLEVLDTLRYSWTRKMGYHYRKMHATFIKVSKPEELKCMPSSRLSFVMEWINLVYVSLFSADVCCLTLSEMWRRTELNGISKAVGKSFLRSMAWPGPPSFKSAARKIATLFRQTPPHPLQYREHWKWKWPMKFLMKFETIELPTGYEAHLTEYLLITSN